MTDFQSFNASADMDPAEIDRVNRDFYGRFNYPWLPMVLPAPNDPGFMAKFLCQEAGDFDAHSLPADGRIWVAGCGTNQAVLTALRFPQAQVLGTDISTRSLEVAARTAAQLGLTNLTLQEASLNGQHPQAEFDYVLCTGVIHHNAHPEQPLATLARALKPTGLMELMVYNYYHRTHTTAYQKAVRLLSGSTGRGGVIDTELEMTSELISGYKLAGSMSDFLGMQADLPEPAVADSLLQPVEYSYTVHTLAALARSAGLSLWQPCVNQFDRLSGQFSWDPPLPPGRALDAFQNLDDLTRWQVANLLMIEKSPMLWFYLGQGAARKTRAEINRDFLSRSFRAAQTGVSSFVLGLDETYTLSPRQSRLPVPALPSDSAARGLFQLADGKTPMGRLFVILGLPQDEVTVTRLRVMLTTPAFPYLVAA